MIFLLLYNTFNYDISLLKETNCKTLSEMIACIWLHMTLLQTREKDLVSTAIPLESGYHSNTATGRGLLISCFPIQVHFICGRMCSTSPPVGSCVSVYLRQTTGGNVLWKVTEISPPTFVFQVTLPLTMWRRPAMASDWTGERGSRKLLPSPGLGIILLPLGSTLLFAQGKLWRS